MSILEGDDVVTLSGHGQSPRPPQPPNRGTQPSSGGRVWWIVAGMAVLVSVALVVWLLVSPNPGPGPIVPVSSTPTPSDTDPAPASSIPVTSADPSPSDVQEQWGELPPKDLDALKTLTADEIPQTVGSYSIDGENRSDYLVIIDYLEAETNRTMGANLHVVGGSYKRSVERLEDATYYGRAVCGFYAVTSGRFPTCLMAGRSQLLDVTSANKDTTIEDVAAFTEQLYDAL